MAETRSKRTKESGDMDDTSAGGMMTELLKFFMDQKREEKQRQEMRDQQFLKIIEVITMKGQDEDKRREEIRIAEARERDERLSEERRIFAERKEGMVRTNKSEPSKWTFGVGGEYGKPRET